jgi:hypothetical protein
MQYSASVLACVSSGLSGAHWCTNVQVAASLRLKRETPLKKQCYVGFWHSASNESSLRACRSVVPAATSGCRIAHSEKQQNEAASHQDLNPVELS